LNKTTLAALLSIAILTSVVVVGDMPSAFAAEPKLNPENGHYYEFITDNNIKWTDAKSTAENSTYNGASGYLVTITSQSENDFVNGILPDSSRAWIGLTDKGREGQYKWVTGEPYSYSNWASGQPSGDNEDYVEMYGWNDKWNDNINWNSYESVTGYVVEYDDVFVHNPANGNYYKLVTDPGITWTDAKAAAENSTYNGISGHLVTITSASENTFVVGLVPNNIRAWMGLTDEVTEGTYEWVTGEPFIFSKWDTNQPDNAGNNEDYIEFLKSSEEWNDLPNDYDSIDGYIIEYTPPPILNPNNRHYYEYISYPGITWTEAKTAAESHTYNGLQGHLVTLTTSYENAFINRLVQDSFRVWMGLSDETTEGQYKWVTGEPFIFSNWSYDEPNNRDNEDYVEFLGSVNKWNDNKNNNLVNGYVVEYAAPVQNPENGHYYQYVKDTGISWTSAKTAAENSTYNGISGHLVTITSASENDFVANLSQDDFRPWIGLTDEVVERGYEWVTGETSFYSNWDVNQPDNAGGNEHYVEFLGSSDKWNDLPNDYGYITGYIIEYDS